MNDMSPVIVPRSDQTNADDLLTGPKTITITKVEIRPGTEQPVAIYFKGDDGKPYRPCKSMSRCLVHCWGPDANHYIGRSMTLYCDPKVTWGGMAVGGIRISHMTDIAGTQVLALTATKGNKKPFTVKPLASDTRPATGGAPGAEAGLPVVPNELLAKYPTLFDIPDGRTWLANLKVVLTAAQTPEDVAEISGLSSVVSTLKAAPPAVQTQIKAMLSGAKERVSAPTWDTPDFGEESTADKPPATANPDTLPARAEAWIATIGRLNKDTLPNLLKRQDYKDFVGELTVADRNDLLVRVRDATQAAQAREAG